MSLIAMGWCRSGARLPNPLILVGSGPVLVIAADANLSSPRHRLHLLQACFDAGVDFIPLAPSQICSPAQALAQAADCSADLQGQLEALTGAGQLTLLLMMPPLATATQSTGRAFLKALHGRTQDAQTALHSLTATLPVRKMTLTSTPTGCQADLLVARDLACDLRADIAVAASQMQDSAMSLVVTGLWPPLSFVHLPTPNAKVPA